MARATPIRPKTPGTKPLLRNWWFWVACGTVLAIWLVAVPAYRWALGSEATGAAVADAAYGAVAALFSAGALGGVVVAIVLQRQELQYQRRELKLSRRELKLQRRELKETRVELQRTAKAQEETARLQELQIRVMDRAASIAAVQAELSVLCAQHSIFAGTGQAGGHSVQLVNQAQPILARLGTLQNQPVMPPP